MFRHNLMLAGVCLLLISACSFAQQQAAPPTPTGKTLADPNAYVRAQFGPLFRLLPKYPALMGDIDADGTEDLFLIATAKDPLIDQAEFHFKTIDPMNGYFGWSDPKDTFQFATQEGDPILMLIIHDWRSDTPKSKFCVINLQFDKLSLGRYLTKKKKVVPSIQMEDRTGQTSNLYWDVKHKTWKWADKSMNME